MEKVFSIWFKMELPSLVCMCCTYFWETPKDCNGDINSRAGAVGAAEVGPGAPNPEEGLPGEAISLSHSLTTVNGLTSICRMRHGSEAV